MGEPEPDINARRVQGQAFDPNDSDPIDASADEHADNGAPKNGSPRKIDAWRKRLTMTDEGFAASVGNFGLILRFDLAWTRVLGFNERSNQVVFVRRPPFTDEAPLPREVRDTDLSRIATWMEQTKPYRIAVSPRSESLSGAINMVAEQQRFDPVRAYIEALTWDGTPRLDRLLAQYFRAEDTDLNRVFGAKWMISGVARTLEPGCKADHVLVLQGPQGCGKSTAARVLAGDEYFGDNLPALTSKDAADYLHGLWVVEISELDAFNRSEMTTAKAFLTRPVDRYRAAYAKRPETHGRRCIFIGTTNEDAYLRDHTGGRRFWPVTVRQIDLPALGRDRDQLWAEAARRYRAGEPWHLVDLGTAKSAADAQEDRYQVDAWEPVVDEWINSDAQRWKTRFTVGDVLEGAMRMSARDWGRPEQMRVGVILQRLGFDRRREREEGERAYFYYRPGAAKGAG